ncbi:unnamed protein product [Penicillium salamii]|uniref:EKC/KEOPS complex subunit BUD32 n=1 Tax=Penicillium salamii TaxID=1612424 RepID=A0A9W4IWA3_9EURO|nr:unnamed protein product [Penicillium salamii]CAG8407796.1 unnamed protein product [Penicillium salamii]CAG8413336.1 unnamed protein product [Penicillium salamii]CAG8418632.1 unnamed protein product [Penicillium salamii]
MIDPQDRFFSEGQGYFGARENPATKTHCDVWDWDQLRLIKVKGTAKLFPPEEDIVTSIIAQFADDLSPEVRAITVDDDGLLTGVSTDPEEDDTFFVGYIPFSICQSLADCPNIYFSQLRELDRLGPGVDLMSYDDHTVAFKFNPLGMPRRLQMSWKEINLLSKLPPHPNIIPFDRIVLEDVESQVIGFTTKYIPDGTLADVDSKRPFRFEWLQQLTQVVDFLNLELGIMHQDIAPRNLLVDPETDKIILFDFDWAANGKEGLLDSRDDVSGVVFTLYEIITNDTHLTSIPHWDRNTDMIQNIEWTCRRELNSDVSKFRKFLNEWIATRTDRATERYLNAPKRLTWSDLPTPPDYSVPFELGRTKEGETLWRTGARSRRIALEKGQYCFRWERPPQSRLLEKTKMACSS